MKNVFERDLIVSCLRSDLLRHIVTLKMLRLFGEAIELRFAQDDNGWALLSFLPVQISQFDRETYPDADFVVLIDGTSDGSKAILAEKLPPGRLVIKSYDAWVRQFVQDRFRVKKVRSFISFTRSIDAHLETAPGGVAESETLVPEMAQIFSHNGYGGAELAGHFAAGARWFAVQDDGRNVSAGFVFRNFDVVWEIGGLFTEPNYRRQGHARKIVAAALHHLMTRQFIPRYQVRSDNIESIRLAEAAGLHEFLQMDHFLTNPG
jgi:ribosomal protein S18 acetylase RimI-like enzyme